MSTTTQPSRSELDLGVDQSRRLSTETKAAFKTTEFIVYIVAVIAVIITANVVDGQNGGPDPFGATTAIRYIVYLTLAYMVARGLAKSGSREHYNG